MKKIPLEKCLDTVPNVFNLILVAARRARQLAYGKSPKVLYNNSEKPTAISLREIGEKVVDSDILKEELPEYRQELSVFGQPEPFRPPAIEIPSLPEDEEFVLVGKEFALIEGKEFVLGEDKELNPPKAKANTPPKVEIATLTTAQTPK